MTATSIVGQLPIIPALPPSLQTVPSWLDQPEAPRDDAWRAEWATWAENLKEFRTWKAKQTRLNPSLRPSELALCAADVAYFLAVWGWIFEPRDTELGGADWYPWCLFPHQVLALRQLEQAWVTKKPRSDVVWEKSRDMGATWLAMGFCAHRWLFARAFSAGLVSYKEDAVDDGTSNSMFFKLRGLLGLVGRGNAPGVPDWMRPAGYIPEVHGRRLKLLHPDKDCEVRGESTTMRSGTGARNSVRVNDEAAKHELFQETLDSIRAATDHILSLSSAYTEYGNDFRNVAKEARAAEDALDRGEPNARLGPRYLRMEWWMHPFHTEEWRANEEAGYASKEAFAREVLIDYQAGNSNLIYFDEAERMPRVDVGDDPAHDLLIAIDPGNKDATGIVFANAWGDPFRPRLRWIDSYENRRKPVEFYAWLLSGIEPEPSDPGYALYADFLGPREHELMAWMLANWTNSRELTVVMDPAGAQVTLASLSATIKPEDSNFPRQLDREVYRLRQRYASQHPNCPFPRGLNVRWKHLYRSNRYLTRRENLRAIMADSEIADPNRFPGTARLLECWMETRFQERTREATTEPGVVHDDFYHLTAASEYLACHVKERGRPGGTTASNRSAQRPRGAQPERKKAA